MKRLVVSLIAAGLVLAPTAFSNTGTFDAPMAKAVRHELVMLPFYSVFDNITFDIQDGVVTLAGEVHRPTLKSSAEKVVRKVEGVRDVVNRIEILPVSPHDDIVRMRVLRAVYSQPSLQRYGHGANPPIHVIVKHGHVTLEGVVANKADSDVAFLRANGVAGAFSVTNNLRIEGGRS